MTDHNTRIFVVGTNGSEARAVAEAIVHDAFHNVAFFDGAIADLPELQEMRKASGEIKELTVSQLGGVLICHAISRRSRCTVDGSRRPHARNVPGARV
jgi:hypothetical protein